LGIDSRDSVARAIIFEKIHGWLLYNEAHGRNRRGGQTWSYNDYDHWTDECRFWHKTTIGRHIRAIEAAGLLTSHQPSIISPKFYAIAKESIDQTQMQLWGEQNSTSGVSKENATIHKQALHKPSTNKRQPATTARARKPLNAGAAVASFQTPADNRDMPENTPSTAEVRPPSNEGDYALALEGAPDKADASQTSPSSAPPPPPAQRFHPDIRAFWQTCEAEPALRKLIAGHEEAHTLAVIGYVNTQNCDNPQALGRVLLAQGFMPPGFPPTAPADDEPIILPSITWSDDDTEPDDETTKPADVPTVDPASQEGKAWAGLQWCIHEQTYAAYLQRAKLLRVEGSTWVIQAENTYALKYLQHPRLVIEIQRALALPMKVEEKSIELRFEAPVKVSAA
jgi:hypothetical protein